MNLKSHLPKKSNDSIRIRNITNKRTISFHRLLKHALNNINVICIVTHSIEEFRWGGAGASWTPSLSSPFLRRDNILDTLLQSSQDYRDETLGLCSRLYYVYCISYCILL